MELGLTQTPNLPSSRVHNSSVRPLSPMQMRFVEEMIKDPSSLSGAARRAGYSPAAASEAAAKLMNNPRVTEMISKATDKAVKALGITKERVLQELWLIATANPRDAIYIDDDGTERIDLKALTKDKAAGHEIIISTTTGTGTGNTQAKKVKNVTIKSPKQSDRIAALVKIGQHLGMFKEQVEVSGNVTLEQLIERSMQAYKENDVIDGEIIQTMIENKSSKTGTDAS